MRTVVATHALALALAWSGPRAWAGSLTAGAPEAPPAAEPTAPRPPADLAAYRPLAAQLIQAATNSSFGYRRLVTLCDTFGPRLCGSTNLEAAIDWALAEMRADGLEHVATEEVRVPHWVRGEESLHLVAPRPRHLRLLGLGGSVGTPAEGLTAEVLVVRNFEELQARAAEARGKIVLFNQPFTTYRQTTVIRMRGAIEAAKAGAGASLIRSVTPLSLQTPHTGQMRYETGVPPLPHAAITLEDADYLQRAQERGERVVASLNLGARTLPEALSRNVVAEVMGQERPEEVVVVGGHFDSWDVGQGAHDDAGGCVAA